MPLTIAIPKNSALFPLYANAESVCHEKGHRHIALEEQECVDALYSGKADIALINPLTFAKSRAELQIIPSRAISAEGYSGLASIHFAPSLETINTVSIINSDFLLQIGLLGLSEKFDVFPTVIKDIASNTICDATISWNDKVLPAGMLDITEEWSDYNDLPLPLGFWACKDEDFSEDLISLTSSFAADEIPDIDEVSSLIDNDDPDSIRVGSMLYTIHKDFIASLESVQQFLYFHHVIPEIRAINIYGS